MRITLLIRSLVMHGAERQLVVLAKSLHASGHKVHVIVLYGGGELEAELARAGIPLVSLGKRSRWDIFVPHLRLIRTIKRSKPEILYGYMEAANFMCSIMKFFYPWLRIIWGIRSAVKNVESNEPIVRIMSRVEPLLARFADLIIFNSNRGKQYAEERGFPPDKLHVVPNGIDTDKYNINSVARNRIRQEFGWSEKTKVIGIVARYDPVKDHKTFLTAASIIAQELSNVVFVSIGGGSNDYLKELRELTYELGIEDRVIWAGVRDDIADIINGIDLLCSSSRREGFSNVIGEAMACGLPCVVTDVGDSAILVRDFGHVVPPQNAQALAEACVQILTEQATVIPSKQAIREHIVHHFSLEILERNTIERFQELLRS